MAEKNQALKYILIGVGITVALGVCGVGSCVALVGGGAFYAYQALDAPAQESSLFLEDLAAGRLDQARERTSKRFKAAHSLDAFRALLQQHSVLLEKHQSIALPSRGLVNDRARIAGVIQQTSGQVGVELELVEEGGKWRIDLLSVAGEPVE